MEERKEGKGTIMKEKKMRGRINEKIKRKM